MLRHKDFRLTAWFQAVDDTAWGDDDLAVVLLEKAIAEQLRPLGLTFQGGPVVHEVDLPAGG